MARFGEKRPAVNLAAVMQALEAKSTAGSLLLNTDNHSMLVSKVVTQGETSYRFYDPNFGLYAFARIEALQQGVQRFVQEESIARQALWSGAGGCRRFRGHRARRRNYCRSFVAFGYPR
jgi:insecticidal toxin